MFVQVNFEYCWYKIFNVSWDIDGQVQDKSLFGMIKNIYEMNCEGVLFVYKDNVVVIVGYVVGCFFFDLQICEYVVSCELVQILMKVEIYNYLIVIVLFFGVFIGFGGEICDEGVIGCGVKLKVGLIGFIVFNLQIFGFEQFWEVFYGKFECIVIVLDIMIEGLLGGVVFNNEFGCLVLIGYFCIFEQKIVIFYGEEVCGYYKLIMFVGGMGNICDEYVQKGEISVGVKFIVFGGLVMLIGLGGGVVFLMVIGVSFVDFDFVLVQCDNLEME